MLAVRQLKPLDKAALGAAPDATGTWLERHTSGTITFVASAAFVLLYVTLDAVSYVFPYHPFPVTPWNPNAGLAIAMTITGGPRYAPAVIIATLLAEIPLRTEGASLLANLAAGLGLGSAYVLTALTMRRVAPDAALERLRDLRLFLMIVVTGTALSALCYVQLNLPPGGVPVATRVAASLRMWLGELTGTFGTLRRYCFCSTGRRVAATCMTARATRGAGFATSRFFYSFSCHCWRSFSGSSL
jgi:integral membrane sensor domain MASE1